MRRLKQNIFILLSVMCMTVLVGFGKKSVDLLDNKPLISLGKAIHDAPIGNQGNDNHNENIDSNESISIETHGEKDELVQQITNETKIYTINIRSKKIRFNAQQVDDLDELESKLKEVYKTGDKILLIDDYAESHIYKAVLAQLIRLNEIIGLEYTEQ